MAKNNSKRKNPKKVGAMNREKMSVEERRQIVAQNILAGVPYRVIADQTGVTVGTISGDFKAILKEWRVQYSHTIDEWVNLQLRRLDRMLASVWESAIVSKDNPTPNLKSVQTALKIMEQQAKIMGLNAPEKVDLTTDGKPIPANVGLIELDYKQMQQLVETTRSNGNGAKANANGNS